MSEMVEGDFIVKSELGIHARPAGRFVTLATAFNCDITIGKDGEWVNGSSVLSILSLAASKGTTLRIRAEGDDAERAVRELGALIESDEELPTSAPG